MADEYVFIDEWGVDAPQEAIFDALTDARSYPEWWKPDVRFDWRVIADRPLLRILTLVLRPVLRWNHNWSIKRAIEGLEPHARSRSG